MPAPERAMRLGELIAALEDPAGAPSPSAPERELTISSLAYDSRAVAPGSLFFCVSGFQADGHDYAPQALERGASALVVERPLGLGVPEILVPSARAAMAPLAARFYGEPARELRVVGVTGTNGKTTTAYLVRRLLESSGVRCGLLGTVKSVVGGVERPVARTTPEAIDLQADLRAMLDGGEEACAIEVSSHALELGRADAIGFAAAIFTNLTQDHLDFHPTMEDYFAAKRRLFVPPIGPPPGVSVLNAGDPYGRRLAQEIPGAITYGVEVQADYRASELRCDLTGCRFTLRTPAGRTGGHSLRSHPRTGQQTLALPMPGRFNVANALAALAACHALGCPLDTLIEALEHGVRVPGRFEPVQEGQDFAVLVDYAHTPDSLENVLRAAREVTEQAGGGRVICVFGAGGDRDRGKRPLMGEIAARLADLVFVTSDNPRSEDPQAIVQEILAGVRGSGSAPASDLPPASDSPPVLVGFPASDMSPASDSPPASVGSPASIGSLATHVHAIVDRREAIAAAVARAATGDVLVIAGKGHEQGQELAGGRKVPFDDVTVAREALLARGERRDGRGVAAGAR